MCASCASPHRDETLRAATASTQPQLLRRGLAEEPGGLHRLREDVDGEPAGESEPADGEDGSADFAGAGAEQSADVLRQGVLVARVGKGNALCHGERDGPCDPDCYPHDSYSFGSVA